MVSMLVNSGRSSFSFFFSSLISMTCQFREQFLQNYKCRINDEWMDGGRIDTLFFQ